MLSIAFAFLATSVAEQMAPAKKGLLQCQSPIGSTKTCDSISRVTQVSSGSYRFENEILIDADGPVILLERAIATVQGNKLCETVRLAEIDKFAIFINGKPATSAERARYRANIKEKFAPIAGRTICTSVVPDEDGLQTVEASISGQRLPILDYTMKWVGPNDGWKVAP